VREAEGTQDFRYAMWIGVGERLGGGVLREESSVERLDDVRAGTLQEKLGDEDVVGVVRLSPGETSAR